MGGIFGAANTPTNAPVIYSGLNVGTSQWNLPVPLFWGTRRLSTNAMAYTNFQKHSQANGKGGGGKGGGGKGSQSYTYTADVLLGLCEGPVDSIQHIWANGSTTTTTTLSALNMTFFNGALGQAPWSYWLTNYPTLMQGYSQTTYLGAPNLDLGSSASVPDIAFECIRAGMFSWTKTGTSGGWINPTTHVQSSATDVLMSDVIRDFLTNPQYKADWSSDDIGSLTQYAAYLRAQGIFASPLINAQEKATSLLDRWAQVTNSWIFWSGTRLECFPLADGAITGNGVTFTPDNDIAYVLTLDDLIAQKDEPPVKISRKDPADCFNRVSVEICDRTLGYISNPIPWTDDYLVDTYGNRNNTSVSAGDICDPAVGRIIAQLIGKRAAYIRNTYQFKTTWKFIRCLPGTVLSIPLNYSGLNIRVRVTGIEENDDGEMIISAEEFPGTAGTYVPMQVTPSIGTADVPNLYAAPSDVNTPAIFEPPASFTGNIAKLIIAASGEANWGGARVWLSFDGTTYVSVGEITAPAPQGVLTASLAAFGGTNPDLTDTLSVDCTQSRTTPQPVTNDDAQNLRTLSLVAPQPTISSGAAIVPTDGELLAFGNVLATGTYSADLTYLERGQYGTLARSHSSGEQFTLIDVLGNSGTSVAFELPAQYIGQTLYIKLSSYNEFGNAAQDLSVCTEYQYIPTGAGYGTGAAGVPGTPTGLAAIAGPAAAALKWNANPQADNIQTYRLYRANGSGASFSSASLVFEGLATTYTDTNAAPETDYTYFLAATNLIGSSGHTAGVSVTTLANGTVTSSNFVFNETPVGTADGTNTIFTLANAPLSGQLSLSVNGSVQAPSAYTLSGNTITFGTAPPSGATILATYLT